MGHIAHINRKDLVAPLREGATKEPMKPTPPNTTILFFAILFPFSGNKRKNYSINIALGSSMMLLMERMRRPLGAFRFFVM